MTQNSPPKPPQPASPKPAAPPRDVAQQDADSPSAIPLNPPRGDGS